MAINSLIVQSGMNNPGPFAGMMAGRQSRQNMLINQDANQRANQNALIQKQQHDQQTAEYDRKRAAQGMYPILSQAAQTKDPNQMRSILGQMQGIPGLLDAGEDLNQLIGLPDDVLPQAVSALRDKAAIESGMASAMPANVRAFDAMTTGLSAEDRDRALRVRLGIEPRAPSAAAKTVKVRGADGRERIGIFDPVSRSLEISTEEGWVPAGPGSHILGLADMSTMVSRSPDEQARLTRAAEVSVTPPKDSTLIEPGNPAAGAAPIPGSPLAHERAEAVRADQERRAQRAVYADVVTQDIDRAIGMVENSRVPLTGIGAWSAPIPGTPAHDLARLLDTIRANAGFDRLQQMREASPTGGALGQVSNFENQLLQATIGNLEQSQSQEQFTRNLRRVRDIYERIVHEGITPERARADGLLPGGGGWSIRRID